MTLDRRDIDFIRQVRTTTGETMKGLDAVIDLILTALISDGHVLLEGNPGLGKTDLVRTLTTAIGFKPEQMGRIQFTPDLMPAEITGTEMPDPDNPQRLKFRSGPIFHWLLLADEINRATPKTQAAMLEAMAERQVTTMNGTRPLSTWHEIPDGGSAVESPFMVLATQNPIDQEGTFDLPEAQLDRFMFKIDMPFPDSPTLSKILAKTIGPRRHLAQEVAGGVDVKAAARATAAQDQQQAEGLARIDALRRAVRAMDVLPMVERHAINMIQASNGRFGADAVAEVGNRDRETLSRLVGALFDYPLGPRAGMALLLGAKAMAVIALVDPDRPATATGETGKSLPRVLTSALRHRLKLVHRWEDVWHRDFAADAPEASQDRPMDAVIERFATLTAPVADGYRDDFRNRLARRPENPV